VQPTERVIPFLADSNRELHTMAVSTKQATGRRTLHFNSYDDILADVHALAAGPVRHVGPLLRTRFLTRPMNPGFQLPPNAAPYLPSQSADAAGIAELERAIERTRTVAERKPHIIFGRMSRQQWDQLHFRHAEMHLSFIVPA
jgi:hypothetical protein